MSQSDSVESSVTSEEAANLLSELVAIDSQNPPGREREVAEFIRDRLEEWGIEARLVSEPDEERPQVVATVGNPETDGTTLVLNGHMDVVPPGDRDQWSVDPFGGVKKEEFIYGRGASDMKGGLATGMLALRAAHQAELDGAVVLTCAMGEETAEPGTKTLLTEVDGDYGIVLEPTELVVDTAGKGLAWYEVDVYGTSAHASRPDLGDNVVDALFGFREQLQAYRDRIANREHELLGKSLCTPTIVDAGEKENVIPNHATLTLDRRFLPDEDPAEIDEEIDRLFEPLREKGFTVNIERTRTYEAAEIPIDSETARVVRTHSETVADIDTSPHGKDASTDQRNFVNDADIPAIIWGPGVGSESHTVDERAPVEPLVDGVEILCRTIDDFCCDSG